MMFIATLLTSPQAPSLDLSLVETLRRAWNGGETVWLAPRQAAEFSLSVMPDRFAANWAALQKRGIDLAVQSAQGRRKRVLLADMDSTMIEQECIDELAAEAGLGAQIATITARAMNGDLDFESALRQRVGLLKGLDCAIIETVLNKRITFASGAETLLATLRANGCHCALVSGGFTDFTSRVAHQLGFDEHRANRLIVKAGHLSGTVSEPILGKEAKVLALREITGQMGLKPHNVIAVGDGANDVGMLQLAGSGVAMHAKPAVAAQCSVRINHGDLTALLFLQGYKSEEFIRK